MYRFSWSMVMLVLCVVLTALKSPVLQVALAEHDHASPFRSPDLHSNVELKLRNDPDSKNSFIVENHGDSSSTSSEMESLVEEDQGQSWNKIWHKFASRVFLLAEEKIEWPELKLGSWRTVVALVLGGIGAAMASAGGIGGGGLFVPLFNLLLQFDAKTSAALSNFMILGGSVANLFINLQQHHPTLYHKPLIDFDVVMLSQPNLLLGISTGVILNVVLPDWVIITLLTLTLSYISVHSFKGALCRWKKETKQNCLHEKQTSPKIGDGGQPQDPCGIPSRGPAGVAQNASLGTAEKEDEENPKTSMISCSEPDLPLLEPLLPAEERSLNESTLSIVPIDKLVGLAVTWAAFFAIQVLRGGKSSESMLGITACGWGYWLLTLTQIPLALGLTIWTVVRLRASHPGPDEEYSDSMQVNEFVLKPGSCTCLAWMALIAGLLGGLLGIGGGMIINPIFLSLGMIPQVTAGTCASMVFFSSSMSVVQFWLMGRVPVQYALTVALLCFLSSSGGIMLVHRAIDKYNRASLIVFSVATVMGLSAVLMAGFGGLSAWENFESGAYMGFHYPC